MNRRKFLTLFGLATNFPWLAHAKSQAPDNEPSLTSSRSQGLPELEEIVEWPIIALVACGGAGIAMSKHIDKSRYGLNKIIAIDTSHRSLQGADNADERIFLAGADKRKPRTMSEVWQCALRDGEAITSALGEAHMVIIVCGLGSAAGGGLANAIGALIAGRVPVTFAFATLPFSFESNNRLNDGQRALQTLKQNCENVCVLSHANLASSTPGDMAFAESLNTASVALAEYLWNTSGCLTRYGLVGIDFEDVRAVLAQGRMPWNNPSSTIGWGEATGVARGSIACRRALNHPALRTDAAGIVTGASVSIRARYRSLRMKDVNEVMQTLKDRHSAPEFHLIFSADYDDSLDDRVQVSILLNRTAS